MSAPDVKNVGWRGLGVLLLINLIALSFFSSLGTDDVEVWARWMREIDARGLLAGYTQSDTDYPPLAFLLLAAVSRSATALEVSRFVVLKCSILLFLFATTACFYSFTRNLLLTAALEFSLILNSVALSYLDIYFAPFLIAAFFLLRRGNLSLGFLLFTISCSVKWQPLIIAPFVCIYVLAAEQQEDPENNRPFAKRLIPFALAAAVVIALLLIFGAKIFDSLSRAMTRHAFLSAYALNLSWVQTWMLELFNPEKHGPLHNGEIMIIFQARDPRILVWSDKILFYLSYAALLFSFARQRKTFERLIVYSVLGYMTYFIFNTGVHENHLFLVCCLAWILAFVDAGQLVRVINLSVAANANLFLFYGVFGQRLSPVIAGFDITLLFAIANLVLFAGFLVTTLKKDGLDLWFFKVPPRANLAG